jgi:hypothetical protein
LGSRVYTASRSCHDNTDVDGTLLWSEIFALVRRPVEISSFARVVDSLTFVLPDRAACISSWGSSIPANPGLRPAIFSCGPAACLVGVRGDFLAAPVGVLVNASFRAQAFALRGLGRECGALRRRAGWQFGDGRPRNRICGFVLGVDVEGHAFVVFIDIAGYGDSLLGNKISRSLEEDLSATSVELRVAFVGIVKCEKLRPRKIVPSLEALRQSNRKQTVVIDDSVSAPSIGGSIIAIVKELEPAVAVAGVIDSRVNLL